MLCSFPQGGDLITDQVVSSSFPRTPQLKASPPLLSPSPMGWVHPGNKPP